MAPQPAFPLPSALRARVDRLGLEFSARFLDKAVERHPENVPALAELATVLTRLGRLEEGLAADERLVGLAPDDPTVRYNLACSLALLGRLEPALDALDRAVELGYDDPEHLVSDEDLASLRAEARFRALVEKLAGKRPSA